MLGVYMICMGMLENFVLIIMMMIIINIHLPKIHWDQYRVVYMFSVGVVGKIMQTIAVPQ